MDADLGGGLIKQRVARKGQGKSGGYRTMIAFRSGDFAVFLFGFAKSKRDNIDHGQLVVLRRIAGSWLSADAKLIQKSINEAELIEAPK